jgi:uncharacterized protein YndB with AHSA1/START domain
MKTAYTNNGMLQVGLTISAPKKEIWSLLTQFDIYSAWNTMIPDGKGSLSENGIISLALKLNSTRVFWVKCRVEAIKEGEYFVLGQAILSRRILYMRHFFELTEQGKDEVYLRQRWELSGWLAGIFQKKLVKELKWFQQMNMDLKHLVEACFPKIEAIINKP